MELHERLVTTKPAASPPKEPFADLRTRSTCSSSASWAPSSRGRSIDPVGMRDRVIADIRRHLSGETGSPATTAMAHERDRRRHPRLRTARAPARGRLDHGDHGQRPGRDLDRAPGPPLRDDGALQRRLAPRRIINRMVAQIGRRIDESSPMVDAHRTAPRQRDHRTRSPARCSRSASSRASARAAGHGQHRLALGGVGRLPAPLHPGAAERARLGGTGSGRRRSSTRSRRASPTTSGS